jgi:hypothetical protein
LITHECESLSPGITNLRAAKPTVHFPTHTLAQDVRVAVTTSTNMGTVEGGHGWT